MQRESQIFLSRLGSLQQQLGAQQQQLVQQLQAVQRQYLMHGPLSVPPNAPPGKIDIIISFNECIDRFWLDT